MAKHLFTWLAPVLCCNEMSAVPHRQQAAFKCDQLLPLPSV